MGETELAKRQAQISIGDFLNYIILVLGIVAMAVVLALLVRVQRGLLGIVLGAVAVVLLAYWVSELRKIVKKELSVPGAQIKWAPELFDKADEIVVIGIVPGPESEVEADFRDGVLEIRGGRGFHEFVTLRDAMRIKEIKYVNRVLQITMAKNSALNVREQAQAS